ncbi:hypothetical protein K1719_034259 [Acacia pycnantha]|nr:hypothetical protein K1719_034259 [Acacia pycnantha]
MAQKGYPSATARGAKAWIFVLSLLGLIPLAERISFLTEQIGYHTGPTVGGLLNATCLNATEIIIAILALNSNKIAVVKYSLLGSILSNLLLVLGTPLLCGGIANISWPQEYDRRQAYVNSLMLLLALLCHMLPMLFRYATSSTALAADPSLQLSRASSIVTLIAYFAYLVFQLWTHRQLFEAQDDSEWVFMVAVMTVFIVLLSKYVVKTIEDASDSWGAVIFAFKNKRDISLGIALGYATQISLFVVPLCVIISWIMGNKMDLNFNPVETVTLCLAIIAIAWLHFTGWNISLHESFYSPALRRCSRGMLLVQRTPFNQAHLSDMVQPMQFSMLNCGSWSLWIAFLR